MSDKHYIEALPHQSYKTASDGRRWPKVAADDDPVYAFSLLPYIDQMNARINELEQKLDHLLARLEKAAERD